MLLAQTHKQTHSHTNPCRRQRDAQIQVQNFSHTSAPRLGRSGAIDYSSTIVLRPCAFIAVYMYIGIQAQSILASYARRAAAFKLRHSEKNGAETMALCIKLHTFSFQTVQEWRVNHALSMDRHIHTHTQKHAYSDTYKHINFHNIFQKLCAHTPHLPNTPPSPSPPPSFHPPPASSRHSLFVRLLTNAYTTHNHAHKKCTTARTQKSLRPSSRRQRPRRMCTPPSSRRRAANSIRTTRAAAKPAAQPEMGPTVRPADAAEVKKASLAAAAALAFRITFWKMRSPPE